MHSTRRWRSHPKWLRSTRRPLPDLHLARHGNRPRRVNHVRGPQFAERNAVQFILTPAHMQPPRRLQRAASKEERNSPDMPREAIPLGNTARTSYKAERSTPTPKCSAFDRRTWRRSRCSTGVCVGCT